MPVAYEVKWKGNGESEVFTPYDASELWCVVKSVFSSVDSGASPALPLQKLQGRQSLAGLQTRCTTISHAYYLELAVRGVWLPGHVPAILCMCITGAR